MLRRVIASVAQARVTGGGSVQSKKVGPLLVVALGEQQERPEVAQVFSNALM